MNVPAMKRYVNTGFGNAWDILLNADYKVICFVSERVSKAEKLRLHCCGTDKMKLIKLLPFARLASPLCYHSPGALNKMAKLLKHKTAALLKC